MLETPEDDVEEDDVLFGRVSRQAMRRQWVRGQMKARKETYTDPLPLSVFCGTYNVNGRADLGSERVAQWLFAEQGDGKDMYILGFQEIVELTPVNVAVDPLGHSRTQYWLNHIAACLVECASEGVEYMLVGVKHLVGVMLCVYVKESLYSAVRDVRWATNAVGVMGVMGNKGGVTCRFSYHSTSICVVCAHLAASRDNVTQRNADFHNIMKQTLLKVDKSTSSLTHSHTHPLGESTSENTSECVGENNQLLLLSSSECVSECSTDYMISDHDIIFWIGDFNYRITHSLTRQDILDMIATSRLNDLRVFDQLNIERSLSRVFANFNEGELSFPPTYKFQVGTDVYECRSGKKKRPPAWCDRILWCESKSRHCSSECGSKVESNSTSGSKAVRLLDYRSADLHASDHKPVSAVFDVTVRSIDRAREAVVYHSLLKELDKMENSGQPKVDVSPLEFHAQRLRYMSQEVFTCEVRNVGGTTARWRFVPKLDASAVSEQWCHATPSYGMLAPDEVTTIKIEIFADLRSLEFLLNQLSTNKADSPPPPPPPHSTTHANECSSGRRSDDDDGDDEIRVSDNSDSDDEEDIDDNGKSEFVECSGEEEAIATVRLQDVMVLRVEKGRDYFLSLSADFCPTREDKELMEAEYAKFQPVTTRPSDTQQDADEGSPSVSTSKSIGKKFFAPEKQEKIKKRWSAIQSNLSKIKKSAVDTVKTHGSSKDSSAKSSKVSNSSSDNSSDGVSSGVSSGASSKKHTNAAVVHEQLHGAFDYDSDENDDIPVGRITSVRVNRTSADLRSNKDTCIEGNEVDES